MGDFVWASKADAAGFSSGGGLTVDTMNSVYVSGSFSGTGYFGTGKDSIELLNRGGDDGFLACWNQDGAIQWAEVYGGPQSDSLVGVTAGSREALHLIGYFSGTVDLPESVGGQLISAGDSDVYSINRVVEEARLAESSR